MARVSIASYYSSFLFDFATRWLPFHRLAWEGLSLMGSVAGILVMAWAAQRAAGKQAAVMTVVLALAAAPVVLYAYVALRGPTWFSVCFLGAGLVALAAPPRWLGYDRPARAGALMALLGIVAGVGLASDPLLAVCGILPLLGTGILLWLVFRGRVAASLARAGVAVTLVALAVAAATYELMPVFGFTMVSTTSIHLAALSRIPDNLAYFGGDVLAFGNAQYPRPPAGLFSLPGLLTIALVAAAVAAIARFLPPLLRHRLRVTGAEPDARTLALAALITFWVLAALGDAGAFVFSSLPVAGVGTARYVLPVFLALTGLAALLAAEQRAGRLAVAAIATVLAVLSTAGMVQLVDSYRQAIVVQEGPKVLSYVESQGITKGYGGYWDAIGLSWRNDSPVGIYPVSQCSSDGAPALCQFDVNSLTTWYRPVAGAKSFVLVNTPLIPLSLANPPPPALGPPAEVKKIGYYTVYVYDYDVGALIGPPTTTPTG